MKRKWIVVFIFAGLLVSACQLFSSIVSSTPKPPPAQAYVFEQNNDPIQLQVSLDEASAAEALIPVAGGSLSASGPDGTIFTLEIPGDALLVETRIRMIPLQDLSGLPFGSGTLMAVQLEPAGLSFNNFVTLKIEPAAEIPIDQQIFYDYQGESNTLGLAIPVVDSREIRLKLLHFSGYGVTKGLLADVESVRQRLGGDVEARLQSAMAEKLSRARQKALLGAEDAQDEIDFEGAMREYIDKVLKPRLAAAGESCAAGRLAMQSLLGISRQAQLLGAEDISNELQAEFAKLFDTVGMVCLKEEYELCKEKHIVHRMIPVWLGIERQLQLLGASDGSGPQSELQKAARDYTERCLNFELKFESEGEFDDGGGGGYTSSVESKIPLKFDSSQITISGSSALINTDFSFRVKGCSTESIRGGGEFAVMSMGYVTDTRTPNDQLGYVRDIKLSYFPGTTSEVFKVTCEDTPTYTSPPSLLWTAIFVVTHRSEITAGSEGGVGAPPDFSGMFSGGGMAMPNMSLDPKSMGFQMEEWEVPAGELFAQKEWIREYAEVNLVERGTFKLYHRPR